jgi:hypothetical protein
VSLPGGKLFTKVSTESRKHTYEYVASSADTEGKSGVTVDIEDDAGNTASVTPTEVEFDFTSPGLKSGPSVNVGYARLDTLIEVLFEADEPLSSINKPVIKLGSIVLSPSDQAGQTYRYSHTAKAEDIADGVLTKGLTLELEDLAGNTTALLMPEKAVTFMVSPPTLVAGSFSVTPSKANAQKEVTARFRVSQALGVDPMVKAGAVEFVRKASAAEPPEYVYAFTTAGTEEQGLFTVTADLKDVAGNEASGVVIGQLTLDYTKPVLAGSPVINKGYAKATDVITVSFTASKGVIPPEVKAGALTFTQQGKTNNDYVYGYTVQGPGVETEGPYTVSISLTDEAGNVSENLPGGGFELDFTNPAVKTVSISPGHVTRGGYVQLALESSEPLSTDPQITIDGKGMTKGGQAGESYTYSYKVTEQDTSGVKGTAITLIDRAGNKVEDIVGPTTEYDFEAPKVSNFGISPAMKMKGDTAYEASFDVSKELDGDPEVIVSNGKDAEEKLQKKSQDDRHYVFSGKTAASGAAPFYGITIKLRDLAGNFSSDNVGTLEIDNVPPELAGEDVSPKKAKLGDVVSVVLTAKETMKGPPTLEAELEVGTGTMAFTPTETATGKNSYTYFSGQISTQNTAGTYKLKPVILEDEAGNVSQGQEMSPATKFEVYSKAPNITSLTTSRGRYSRMPNYDEVEARITCEECANLGAGGVSAKVDGKTMGCGNYSATAPNFICTRKTG